MSGRGPTVVRKVAFTLEEKGRKRLGHKADAVVVDGERIPRKVQLLALAIEFEALLARGEVHSYADLARICGVSRARVSQIMATLEKPIETQEDALKVVQGVPCTIAVVNRLGTR